jgi:hypothetical protein
MTRGAQPVAGERVADAAQLVLGRPSAAVHDLGSEHLAAVARILVRLEAAQAVVDVERRDAVAEGAQHVPETRGVGAAGDEADHLAAGRDQAGTANVALDRSAKGTCVHMREV